VTRAASPAGAGLGRKPRALPTQPSGSTSLSGRDTDTLIDRIYEAAVVPEKWPAVLEELTERTEASFASMIAVDDVVVRWTGTPAAIRLIDEYKAVEHVSPNIRIPRVIAKRHPGFLTDFDLLTREEIDNDPFYRDFMRPRGYGWVAGTVIEAPSGETLIFAIERQYRRGPVEKHFVKRLDTLRPHLARAALMSARLRMERARAMTETLGMLGLPAAVLHVSGRLLAANSRFETLIPSRFKDHRARLTLADRGGDALLAEAIAWQGNTPRPVRSIPVARHGEAPPMIVHLIPVRGAARDLFPSALLILLVTPVVAQKVPAAEMLQGLFDLTPAEARVARAIGEGFSAVQAGRALGIARETTRTRLKSVLAKTGLHRQAELANLLAGVTTMVPDSDKVGG